MSNFQDGGHYVISQRKVPPYGEHLLSARYIYQLPATNSGVTLKNASDYRTNRHYRTPNLENKAPKYPSVHCTPVTAVSSRHLRSANQHQLTTLRCRRITFGRRAFSVAGPMVWNSLPTEFRDLSFSFGDFRRSLKTILFARY